MKAYRVSLPGAQNSRNGGPPWPLWRNGFCLAACLAERHVQGRMQGTTARHGTRVIVGHRLFFSRRHLRSAFGAKPAELVENDPERKSTIMSFKVTLLKSGPTNSKSAPRVSSGPPQTNAAELMT